MFPTPVNPGYSSGDAFTFDESVHGIVGFVLTITLNDVIEAGPAGWTTNIAESAPPIYPSTVNSQGAIKLTSNENSWIFGTDGTTDLPSGAALNFGNGNSYIQAGQGFHINSEEGISLEAVDISDPFNPITKGWYFGTDGMVTLPDAGVINQGNAYTKITTPLLNAVDNSAVIWTALYDYISSVKLTIQLETDQVGDATGWHSQVCEAIIASRGWANNTSGYGDPIMTVYGVTYTSTVSLATFTVQRNATTRMIEIVATRTAATDSGIDFRIHSVEMSSRV